MVRPIEHPREELKNKIMMYAAIGTPYSSMAKMIGVSTKTLHRHYQDELDMGADFANAIVGNEIFNACRRGDPWALKFWASRKMGWTERQEIDVTARTDQPKSISDDLDARVGQLSNDEVLQLEAVVKRLAKTTPDEQTIDAELIEGNVVEFNRNTDE